MSNKSLALRNIIQSPQLEFLMEAHNGISAIIVEEAGFKGIWGSGLSISASLGVRDNNEASWTQVLDVLEFMSDATSIPILLDGDTGYGNFNNVSRLVKKLEQREIAGVCIEDKLFPKTNSFISGETQPLAAIDEFCGKIRAAKDVQQNPDFCVVARTEAFIAGWGLPEALRRAEAYRQAGADAILVHSKRPDPGEIEQFMAEWAGRLPVIIVPTKYYSTPTNRFRDLGISIAIWANHTLRASVEAMQETTRQIFRDESLVNIERRVASVAEIFRLQGEDELREAEKRYLPTTGKKVNAIILAASQGDLGELTRDIPKTMLKVQGKTVLARQLEEFNLVGIKDISVVRGFAKDTIAETNIRTIDNDLFDRTKDLYSLYLAREELREHTVISYGDIIFKSYILNDLLIDSNDITLIVDADCENSGDGVRDFVRTDAPYSRKLFTQTARFSHMGTDIDSDLINGEFIGLWKVTAQGAETVRRVLEQMSRQPDFGQKSICDLLNEVSRDTPVAVKFIKGSWLDIDTIVDLQKAGEF
jgi:phosphoenolpyruvate phosphomutase